MHTYLVPVRPEKKVSDPLGIEVTDSVSNHMAAGNQIWVLCESSLCSQPLSHGFSTRCTSHLNCLHSPVVVNVRNVQSTLPFQFNLQGQSSQQKMAILPLWWAHRTAVFCFRYLGYMCDLLADKPYRPHFKPLTIKAITVSPIPFFNKQRNGCRPYCDVLIGETKIFSTCTDFERMK